MDHARFHVEVRIEMDGQMVVLGYDVHMRYREIVTMGPRRRFLAARVSVTPDQPSSDSVPKKFVQFYAGTVTQAKES